MKKRILNNWPKIALTMAGILAGFLYWRFIGCNSGACPITSNWHISSLFGGVLGFLSSDLIPDSK